MEHVTVLQRQLAYVQQQQQQQQQRIPPAPADLPASLDSASAGGPSDVAARGDGSQRQQEAPEVPFLRHRVEHLTVENRQLRRQCVQLKLLSSSSSRAAAEGPGGGAEDVVAPFRPHPGEEHQNQPSPLASAGPLGLPLFDGLHRQADALTPGAQQRGGPPSSSFTPNAAQTPTREEEALRRELSETAAELDQLRIENSRLMEMSNALRSDRDRLLTQQGGTIMARGGGPWGRPDGGRSAVEASSPLPPDRSVVVRLPSPVMAASKPEVTSASNPEEVLQVAAVGASSNPEGRFGASVSPSRSHSQPKERSMFQQSDLPSTAIFAQEDAELEKVVRGRQRKGMLSTSAAAGFFTDSGLNKRSSNAFQDGGAAGFGWVSQRDRSADMAEVAVARAQHRSRSPTAEGRGGVVSASGEGGEGVQASAISPGSRPPSVVPGSASSRETASQRSRLQALQRRREEEATRPRVRNYNQRDDH